MTPDRRVALGKGMVKMTEIEILQSEIAELKANLKRATSAMSNDVWKNAVIDELVCCYIYQQEHEHDPRKAIQDIIKWNCDVALEPAVSSDAQALVDRTVQTCIDHVTKSMFDPDEVDLDKEYYRAYNIALKNAENSILAHFAESKNCVDNDDFAW